MKTYSSRRIHEGRVVNLRIDEIDKKGGGRRLVEVVEHNGGVIIIAQPTPSQIILVRQHRHAVEEDLWEVPAGMLEGDEDPREAALRELREETGYRAERMQFLWSVYTTPGFCTERLHVFVADGLSPGEQEPDDNEQIEARVFAVDEAWEMVESDRLRDAKSQVAIAWARHRP